MPEVVTQLVQSIGGFIPGLIGAVLLLIVAWIVGSILRFVVIRLARVARLDQRVNSPGLTANLGDIAYWLAFLFFLPGILGSLGLVSILVPVQTLLVQFLGFLPNVFAAIVILVIGLFVARLVRQIVTNLLAAIGVDRLSERVGLASTLGDQRLSGLLGMVLYVLILIPVLTAALDALHLSSLTTPISDMLNKILASIPNIFAAALVLILSFVIGR